MSSPTLKVEVAFTSEPLDTTPTWVDVSAYVRATSAGGGGVFISRGKGAEIGPFEAGLCRVTLSNRDRRFDPSYSAGPNFGNLIPRKQLRVTATWSAVDYPMFYGWVTGWPQDFTNYGEDATVTVEAVDSLAVLANMNLERDLAFDYADVTLGSLALFLRQADQTKWWDAAGDNFALPTGAARVGSPLADGLLSTSVSLDPLNRWDLNTTHVSTGPWSMGLWFQTAAGNAENTLTYGSLSPDTSGLQISVTAGVATILYYTADPVAQISTSVIPVNDNGPHHVLVTSDGATLAGYNIYVDGVNRTASRSGGYQPLYVSQVGFTSDQGTATFSGSVEDLVVWDQELTALEVQAFYSYSYGFFQESSATRVTRYLDDVGWPAAWREITTNQRATVGELIYGGASALPKLQEVERSEQGMLFATKAGFVAFRERYYANEVTVGNTVQQIFSDDGGATALPYSTFGFRYNDIDVTNDATVTTPTTWAKSSDATSITVNGRQSKKVDTILSTFDQANTMAAGIVAKGKNATYRVPPITVYPAHNTTRWDEVLGLELGYRVGVEQTPMGVGSQNAQEVTLEFIEWSIVDTLWTFTMGGSPCFGGVAGAADWFVVGTSTVGGVDVIGY